MRPRSHSSAYSGLFNPNDGAGRPLAYCLLHLPEGALGLDGLLDYSRHGLARDIWRSAGSGKIPEAVQAPGIEALQPLVHPLLGPHQVGGSLAHAHLTHADNVDGKHLCTALESLSFLYAFSSSSCSVLSIPHQHGRGSLLVLVWRLQPERTFSRRYRSQYAEAEYHPNGE